MSDIRWLPRLHSSGVIVAAAIGIYVLPYWRAFGLAIALCLWAVCEVVISMAGYRRRDEIRTFIQRELDRMPRPEAPPVQFPRAWQPFVGHSRPKKYVVHHSVRSDAAIR